jgi:hypothetical protein
MQTGFVADVRLIIGEQMADYYTHMFELGILYFDSDGRIVEAGAVTEEEVP